MFIEYSQDAIDNSTESIVNDSLLLACIAMKSGDHVVCTENEILAVKIRDATKGTEDSISRCFDKLNEKFSQIASVKKAIGIFVRIVSGNAIQIKRATNNKKVIEIGIILTIKNDFWRKTYLVIENLEDEKGYRLILDCCNSQKLPTTWEHVLGGGITTVDVAADKNRQNSFVLCLVDSDRHYPKASLGVTAQKIQNVITNALCCLETTQSHEIENLFFGESVLNFLMNGSLNAVQQRIISSIRKATSVHNDIPFFYDIKRGYRYKEVKDVPYLLEAFATDIRECKKWGKKGCICCQSCSNVIVEAMGKNFLPEVIKKENIQQQMPSLYNNFPTYVQNEWVRISNLLMSWCCGIEIGVLGV